MSRLIPLTLVLLAACGEAEPPRTDVPVPTTTEEAEAESLSDLARLVPADAFALSVFDVEKLGVPRADVARRAAALLGADIVAHIDWTRPVAFALGVPEDLVGPPDLTWILPVADPGALEGTMRRMGRGKPTVLGGYAALASVERVAGRRGPAIAGRLAEGDIVIRFDLDPLGPDAVEWVMKTVARRAGPTVRDVRRFEITIDVDSEIDARFSADFESPSSLGAFDLPRGRAPSNDRLAARLPDGLATTGSVHARLGELLESLIGGGGAVDSLGIGPAAVGGFGRASDGRTTAIVVMEARAPRVTLLALAAAVATAGGGVESLEAVEIEGRSVRRYRLPGRVGGAGERVVHLVPLDDAIAVVLGDPGLVESVLVAPVPDSAGMLVDVGPGLIFEGDLGMALGALLGLDEAPGLRGLVSCSVDGARLSGHVRLDAAGAGAWMERFTSWWGR